MLNNPEVKGKGIILKYPDQVKYAVNEIEKIARKKYPDLDEESFQKVFDEMFPGNKDWEELDRLIGEGKEAGIEPRQYVIALVALIRLNMKHLMMQA